MGDMDRQKWMASIRKALEELKKGTEFISTEGRSSAPPERGNHEPRRPTD
jgi:hypothetical protein